MGQGQGELSHQLPSHTEQAHSGNLVQFIKSGWGQEKQNQIFPCFFPGLEKKGREVISSPPEAQGDGECGLCLVHHMPALPLLPPQRQDSSHASPAPAWGPSPGKQSLPSAPVGSFPGGAVTKAQNIKSEGTPKDHQIQMLSEWPLWGSVLQGKAAPAWVPHGITNPASKPPPAHAALPMGAQLQHPAASHTL